MRGLCNRKSALTLFMAAGCLIAAAWFCAGCGGGGGSSAPATPASTTITTNLVAPTGGAGRTAGRTGSAALTAATVRIITASGQTYTMTHSGSGVYTATVSGLPSNFIIEARQGDLVLENMFNDIASGLASFHAGETNATTTAFVEIAKVMVESLGVSGIDTSNNLNLLSSLENAQVSIDMVELKTDIVDNKNGNYTQVVTSFSTVLAACDKNNTSSSDCLTTYKDSTEFSNTADVIKTFEPPVESDDKTAIRNAAYAIASAYSNKDVTTLLSYMGSNFILEGYTNTGWTTKVQNEWLSCTFTVTFLSISIEDLTSTTATALIKNQWKDVCGTTTTEGLDIFEAKFQKTNGVWKWIGDQQKVDLWWQVTKEKQYGVSTDWRSMFYSGLEETSTYPVASASVTGSKLSGAISYTDVEDSEDWTLSSQDISGGHAVGDTYTVTVNFEDGTSQTIPLVVRALPPDVTAVITSTPAISSGAISVASGTATIPVTYELSGETGNVGTVNVWIGDTSGTFRYQLDQLPTAAGFTIPTTGMPSAMNIHSRLNFIDLYDHARTVYYWNTIYGQ